MHGLSDREVLAALRQELAGAAYVCVREPLADPACPETSDIDVLVFDDADGLLPERRRLAVATGRPLTLDLLHAPARSLEDPEALAAYGLILHRLLGSRPVVAREPYGHVVERVAALARRPDLRTRRIRGFLEMGAYTVREIGITWDFPELAVLWSALAQAACVAAMTDATGGYCPNVYTRPLEHLRSLEGRLGLDLERRFVAAAHLDADPSGAAAALERMHAVIARRFPEPEWPAEMRSATRAEYRYFAAPEELAFRVGAAREMRARGDSAAALFYLRFHAYMLARVPMVARCAREGRDVSFVRPERAVRRVLSEDCPEALEGLRQVLGGGARRGVAEVEASLEATLALRQACLAFLRQRGYELGSLPPWEPFRPPPGSDGAQRRGAPTATGAAAKLTNTNA